MYFANKPRVNLGQGIAGRWALVQSLAHPWGVSRHGKAPVVVILQRVRSPQHRTGTRGRRPIRPRCDPGRALPLSPPRSGPGPAGGPSGSGRSLQRSGQPLWWSLQSLRGSGQHLWVSGRSLRGPSGHSGGPGSTFRGPGAPSWRGWGSPFLGTAPAGLLSAALGLNIYIYKYIWGQRVIWPRALQIVHLNNDTVFPLRLANPAVSPSVLSGVLTPHGSDSHGRRVKH